MAGYKSLRWEPYSSSSSSSNGMCVHLCEREFACASCLLEMFAHMQVEVATALAAHIPKINVPVEL